ncbi:uncharacterized protein BT62DRAFT_1071694 [Guyanagaster necrorhizus]|uniref:Uncharacterized protein n=1 Tax=Guyanagaster necrorhizus TaxID=856835 RepID=A0A9P7W0L4_9AGAR|nr:uncharacterized protein BT62DRAFT_1071694 [Guyanagaster necrorhizus MCA 3950]KAG7451096.1 hypothetical protein BT62DRAFT_1071694 [Guyanagaster necrorhizus MCA 3950]
MFISSAESDGPEGFFSKRRYSKRSYFTPPPDLVRLFSRVSQSSPWSQLISHLSPSNPKARRHSGLASSSHTSRAAVFTSLLAAVAARLLSAINDVVDGGDFKQNANLHVLNVLYVTSFGAIILNTTTVTSLLLIDELGDLPDIAAADPYRPKAGSMTVDQQS